MQDKIMAKFETWGALTIAAATFGGCILHGALTHGWTWL